MKPFTRIAVVVLWLIALLQLVRFIAGWQITPNGAAVTLWLKGWWRWRPPDWGSWSGANDRGSHPEAAGEQIDAGKWLSRADCRPRASRRACRR